MKNNLNVVVDELDTQITEDLGKEYQKKDKFVPSVLEEYACDFVGGLSIIGGAFTVLYLKDKGIPVVPDQGIEFCASALFTSEMYRRVLGEASNLVRKATIFTPLLCMTAFEYASKYIDFNNTYDPKDIISYTLGALTAYCGVNLVAKAISKK